MRKSARYGHCRLLYCGVSSHRFQIPPPPAWLRRGPLREGAFHSALHDERTTSLIGTALGVAFQQSVGILLGETGRRELPVEVRPQVLYNPSMRAPNFFVPGVIGTALQIAASTG